MAPQKENPRLFKIALEGLRVGLNDMEQFIRAGESALQSEFESWGEWYDQQTQGFSEEEKQDFIDAYYDDVALVCDMAPQHFRRACVIMLIGYWETTAANLVRTLRKLELLQPPPDKCREPLYHWKSKACLLDYGGFDKSVFGQAWNFCEEVNIIRDIIAHSNSRIPYLHPDEKYYKESERAKLFIEGTPDIYLSNSYIIELDSGFSETVNRAVVESIQCLMAEAQRIHRQKSKTS